MDIITVVGAVIGVALLVVMALTPLLLALPEPARRVPSTAPAARRPLTPAGTR